MKLKKTIKSVASKSAKFVKNNKDEIRYAAKYVKQAAKSGNVPGALLDATVGIAKRKGEKYLDKKLGGSRGYRIAKAGFNAAYDIGTGNPMGAIKSGTQIYSEIDPNKKRAAKISGIVNSATNLADSAMSGNFTGAVRSGAQLYSEIDPNKKRAAKVSGAVVGATGLASSLMKGDPLGAYQSTSQLYSVVDPNKKRVQKVNHAKSSYIDPVVKVSKLGYNLAK